MIVLYIVLAAIAGLILGGLLGSSGKQTETERAEYAIKQVEYWYEAYINLLDKGEQHND